MNILIIGAGGIGSALAKQYEACGHTVFVASRSNALQIDLLDENSIKNILPKLPEKIQRIIVTAGILHSPTLRPERQLSQITLENLQNNFAVNAFGPILLLKHLAPRLDGVFACLSARVGSIGDNRLGGWYSYRASKAAQNQLMRTAAIELKRKHPKVIVASLHPGTVDTNLSKPFQGAAKNLFRPEQAAEYLMNIIENLKPEDSGCFKAWDGENIPY